MRTVMFGILIQSLASPDDDVVHVPRDVSTIAEALQNTTAATVIIGPGVHPVPWPISRPIHLRSELGPNRTRLTRFLPGDISPMFTLESSPSTLEGFTISDIRGIHVGFGASVVIKGNVIDGQRKSLKPGIRIEGGGSVEVIGNLLINSAWGIQISVEAGATVPSDIKIERNVIAQHFNAGIEIDVPAEQGGGCRGLGPRDSTIRIENCTIVENAHDGLRYSSCGYTWRDVFVSNSIIWGQRSDSGSLGSFDPWQVTFSLIDIPWLSAWNGNIFANPRFVRGGSVRWDPEEEKPVWELGDYHLLPGSPCIDAGDPESALDPDGTRADIGALYFHPWGCPRSESLVCAVDGQSVRLSWKNAGEYETLAVLRDGATVATFSGDSETFEDGGVSFGEHEYEILAWEGWNDCEPIRCLVRFVAPAPFIRGDANGDGGINLGDAVFILDYLFAGRNTVCEDAADVNDDGKVDLSDPIALLAHLFAGGLAPYPPFPEAGGDPTNDALRCAGA